MSRIIIRMFSVPLTQTIMHDLGRTSEQLIIIVFALKVEQAIRGSRLVPCQSVFLFIANWECHMCTFLNGQVVLNC